MKVVQIDECLLSTVNTEGLMHQGISSYSNEYALIRFQLFMD